MRRLSFLFVALLASCEGTPPDEATDAMLHVQNAQFFRGAMPTAENGPAVKNVSITPIVHPGATGRTCTGDLDPSATAVALALDGDVGYWIVTAGIPSVAAKGEPTFQADLGYSVSLGLGRKTFFARAVDGAGNFGPSLTKPLDVTPVAMPTGNLVIALSWDNEADLDLHVVDPHGIEIWKRNINSYEPPPPGAPPEAPNTPHPGGILDFDSNASCVSDGRHAENVVYAKDVVPPSGHYVALVDTSSLCGEVTAHWRVEAIVKGVSVGVVQGTSTEYDTRFPHDRGAGVRALEFDVP